MADDFESGNFSSVNMSNEANCVAEDDNPKNFKCWMDNPGKFKMKWTNNTNLYVHRWGRILQIDASKTCIE